MAVSDDMDLNNVAAIPGMGIPEQLKAAMEQEQSSKSHPGTQASSKKLNTYLKHCGGLDQKTANRKHQRD